MAETLMPRITSEVVPLVGPERDDVIAEAQALLSEEQFNPIYFSRVIGDVARLIGGTSDVDGSRIVTPPLLDTEHDRALVIWHYPKSTNSLWVEPSWVALPDEEQAAARGHEPYTREHTSITYRYDMQRYVPGEGYVHPPAEETSVLTLSSRLWFPINTVDRHGYLGGQHWSERDGDVSNGWASREKEFRLGPDHQRQLAQRVFDSWRAGDPISQGQQTLPLLNN